MSYAERSADGTYHTLSLDGFLSYIFLLSTYFAPLFLVSFRLREGLEGVGLGRRSSLWHGRERGPVIASH